MKCWAGSYLKCNVTFCCFGTFSDAICKCVKSRYIARCLCMPGQSTRSLSWPVNKWARNQLLQRLCKESCQVAPRTYKPSAQKIIYRGISQHRPKITSEMMLRPYTKRVTRFKRVKFGILSNFHEM